MPRTSPLVASITPTDSPAQERPSFQKRFVMVFFALFALLSGSIFMTIGVKQLHLATASRTWPKTEARVDHHKQADRIWIHYDPARPGQSAYRPGPQHGTYLLVALAALPLLFGTTLLVLVLRQLRTPRNVAPFP